jgi:hypothetical protein
MNRAKNPPFYRPIRGQFEATIVGLHAFFDVQWHHENGLCPRKGFS